MRSKIVAGNWKMNKELSDGRALAQAIKNQQKDIPDDVNVILAPPFIHLADISREIIDSRLKMAAQNCAEEEKGAYTGEISAPMIRSTGAQYIIIGHSERRSYYHETDDILYKKVQIALKNDLFPIFCCGESLEQRDNDQYFSVVESQLENTVFKLSAEDFSRVLIAYEPVWAIGTGKTATPEQAQEMHRFIRQKIQDQYTRDGADNTSILYGGSCKPSNAADLFSQPDIDGGLIGGASLKANDFIAICKSFT
ncbi:MAG TPA: triose-phosphate isomerase [Bacteroidales bacterium]|nr:triose-phosphate isomerase [Bacteroidales bacterium]